VSDDGRGHSFDDSSPAVAATPKTGLGSTIIAGLVAQLKGTMTMRNENGTRTEIRVAAPVAA
jgi:two-component sensor histidine kinase